MISSLMLASIAVAQGLVAPLVLESAAAKTLSEVLVSGGDIHEAGDVVNFVGEDC
jgi:hypothetical protein